MTGATTATTCARRPPNGGRRARSLWRGDQSWEQALRAGSVTLLGPTDVRRQVPTWLGASAFAPVPRPVA